MILFVENRDSFSWNVIERLPVPRAAVEVVRGDAAAGVRRRLGAAAAVVIGPGPTDPDRAGLVEVVREAAGRGLPVLGICLGHQAIGLAFGARLVRATPTHGKRSTVAFAPSRLFPGVVGPRVVMRYHSLALAEVVPPLRVFARTADGLPMAVEHETLPIAGLQFHPDSFGTPEGEAMLAAFFRAVGAPVVEARTAGVSLARGTAGVSPARGTAGVSPAPRTTVSLAELAERPSFALLGPGYGGGRWRLIEDLRPAADGALVYAPYEARAALRYGGRVAALAGSPVAARGAAVPPPALDAADFPAAVGAIRAAIEAGDVYQVCLTRRARLGSAADGAGLFAAICAAGAPPYACWVRLPDGEEFVSGSPELFFEIRGRRVRSCPMKGTAPAGAAAALRASAKDDAELAMITDLVRNDLATVCEPGTVTVRRARRLMELPYAVQTVSDVAGRLRAGVAIDAVLAALHPGGSVTGAPKAAALAAIPGLEPGPRGAYCGALGYVEGDRATVALLIRTATRDAEGWVYGVGGGIVHDSDPARELAELYTKTGALGCASPR